MNSLPELILASTSPYRKELLARLSIPFKCVSPEIDEDSFKKDNPSPFLLAKKLAYAKAEKVFKTHPSAYVIGGDQVLAFNDIVFGKPGTEKIAMDQLLQLQGKTHQLITSVCLLTPQTTIEFSNIATMTMRNLTKEQIATYIRKDQPLNCCGSYKLESLGISLFEQIDCDDHTAIIGIPLLKLTDYLLINDFKIL